jgi:NADH:ubiquinone oxidoreductase subunit 3 (subunit A)
VLRALIYIDVVTDGMIDSIVLAQHTPVVLWVLLRVVVIAIVAILVRYQFSEQTTDCYECGEEWEKT